jgi:hypothetical protein
MIFTGMDTPLSIQQFAQPRTIYIEWNARAFVAAHHCGCHRRGSTSWVTALKFELCIAYTTQTSRN